MVVIDYERMGMANSDVAMTMTVRLRKAPPFVRVRVMVIMDMRVVVRELGVIVEEHLRVFRRP